MFNSDKVKEGELYDKKIVTAMFNDKNVKEG